MTRQILSLLLIAALLLMQGGLLHVHQSAPSPSPSACRQCCDSVPVDQAEGRICLACTCDDCEDVSGLALPFTDHPIALPVPQVTLLPWLLSAPVSQPPSRLFPQAMGPPRPPDWLRAWDAIRILC